ncbi:hypothetical protein F2Q70_00026363 [Brassica cretica]|uniref:DUF1985 domain-containing protein n=1 Tax=Brassica cretica TaxID=69181 RepID=A0A8S9LAW2_BRACR|nr:hypothetical protein F2Q70_00026363 [Brassica cretica]
MDGWKMIRIALIIIVDGVFIAHKQEARPTPRYVRMVENLKKKFAFLWGRESFLKTISCMKPLKFVRMRRSRCYTCQEAQAAQFQITRLPTFTSVGSISTTQSIPSICRVKFNPNLINIFLQQTNVAWWGYIRASHQEAKEQGHNFTNVQLTEMVIQVSAQVKQLRREMKRRKKRSHGRQSSFNTLFSRRKQSNTPSHSPEPTPTHTDGLHNQDDSPMEIGELPQTRSPIISQYEAQLHRDSTADHLSSSHVSDPCIHTQSVHVSPNHNNTSVHTSPDHNIDSAQVSPVYLGTIHHIPPVSQMITHTNDATDDYDEPPRTPVSVQPPWSELNSVVYDKSDHPQQPGDSSHSLSWCEDLRCDQSRPTNLRFIYSSSISSAQSLTIVTAAYNHAYITH